MAFGALRARMWSGAFEQGEHNFITSISRRRPGEPGGEDWDAMEGSGVAARDGCAWTDVATLERTRV